MHYTKFVDSLYINVVMNRKSVSESNKLKWIELKTMCCENQWPLYFPLTTQGNKVLKNILFVDRWSSWLITAQESEKRRAGNFPSWRELKYLKFCSFV
jgi:hypothetical protein